MLKLLSKSVSNGCHNINDGLKIRNIKKGEQYEDEKGSIKAIGCRIYYCDTI